MSGIVATVAARNERPSRKRRNAYPRHTSSSARPWNANTPSTSHGQSGRRAITVPLTAAVTGNTSTTRPDTAAATASARPPGRPSPTRRRTSGTDEGCRTRSTTTAVSRTAARMARPQRPVASTALVPSSTAQSTAKPARKLSQDRSDPTAGRGRIAVAIRCSLVMAVPPVGRGRRSAAAERRWRRTGWRHTTPQPSTRVAASSPTDAVTPRREAGTLPAPRPKPDPGRRREPPCRRVERHR